VICILPLFQKKLRCNLIYFQRIFVFPPISCPSISCPAFLVNPCRSGFVQVWRHTVRCMEQNGSWQLAGSEKVRSSACKKLNHSMGSTLKTACETVHLVLQISSLHQCTSFKPRTDLRCPHFRSLAKCLPNPRHEYLPATQN